MKKEKMEKKLKKLSVLVRDLEDKLHSHADWIHHATRENAELRGKVQDLEGKLLAKASKVDLQVFQHNTEECLNEIMQKKADKVNVTNLENILSEANISLVQRVEASEKCVTKLFDDVAEIENKLGDKVGRELLDTFANGVTDQFSYLQKDIMELGNKVKSLYPGDGIMRVGRGLTQIGSGVGKTTTINGGQINCNKTTSDSLGFKQQTVGRAMEDAGIVKASKRPEDQPDIQFFRNCSKPYAQITIPEGKILVQTECGFELRNKPTQWQVAPEDVQGWKTTTDYAQQFLDRVDGNVFTTEEKEQAEKLAESMKWIMDLNTKYENNIGGGINLNALALHSTRILLDMMNRMDNNAEHIEKLQRDFDDEIGKMNAVEYPTDDLSGPEEFAIKHDLKPEKIVADKAHVVNDPLAGIHERLDVLEKLICQKAEIIDVNEALRLIENTDKNVASLNTKREVDQERFDLLEEEDRILSKQYKELAEGVSQISRDINAKVDAANVWVNDANRKITGMYKRLDETDKIILDSSPLENVKRRMSAVESILNMQILPALGAPAIISDVTPVIKTSPTIGQDLSGVPLLSDHAKIE